MTCQDHQWWSCSGLCDHRAVTAAPFPEQLETERLVLRRRRVEDASAYREMWAERDPRVPPHRRIDAHGHPTVEDIAESIRTEGTRDQRSLLTIVRRDEGDVIGYCGLIVDGRGTTDEPEIAYELLAATHGLGYATEAAAAVVAWADDRGCERLWAGVRDWNVASRNVLRKLDFVETGRIEPDDGHGASLVFCRLLPV